MKTINQKTPPGYSKFMKTIILPALLVAILSSPVLAGFTEGVAAYASGDVLLAVKEFRAAAEEGHADSQFNL